MTEPIYKSAEGERVIMEHYDRVLARWPAPYEPLYVDTRHGRTFAIASGDPAAPALVLLHGSASNAVFWISDAVAYSPYYRVYAVDIPGEPGRSAHNRPDWNGPAFGEWMEDVLDGLHIAKASLLGISQGGWTALKFATARPERVEKLVLLAPGGVAPARPSFLLRAIVFSMMGRRGAEAINRIVLGDQTILGEALVYMNEIMTNFKPRIGAQALFSDEELSRLTMPVLLIAGGRDAILPSEKTVARLQKLLPRLTVDLRPTAGHALVDVAPAVIPFLGVQQIAAVL
jgi:pimeloyl-ACP methyl ester carboxylesterase